MSNPYQNNTTSECGTNLAGPDTLDGDKYPGHLGGLL